MSWIFFLMFIVGFIIVMRHGRCWSTSFRIIRMTRSILKLHLCLNSLVVFFSRSPESTCGSAVIISNGVKNNYEKLPCLVGVVSVTASSISNSLIFFLSFYFYFSVFNTQSVIKQNAHTLEQKKKINEINQKREREKKNKHFLLNQ